jgi:hypothetical protein
MEMKKLVLKGLTIVAVLTLTGRLRAQEAAAAPAPDSASIPAAPVGTTARTESSADGADGLRFRFGVSGGYGFFTAKSEAGSAELSCTYYGMDLRFGAQINDLIGVYAQPTLGYYSADSVGPLAVGGLLGIAAGADVTFLDRFFAGAGIGYTVYNNPSGISPLLRVGAYPLMSRNSESIRRRGLMVNMDLRFTKLEGLKTIVMPTFNIGYEAF